MKLYLTVLLVLLAGCKSIERSNDKAVLKFMKEGNIPGLFMAVVKADSVLYEKAFGVEDIISQKPVTRNTAMELGSISKAFAAEDIIELVHLKQLNLNDPVTKYLIDAPASWDNIKIIHLLTHSSGIKNYLIDPLFEADKYFIPKENNTDCQSTMRKFTADTLLKMFYSLPLEFSPGETWSYSNTGYIILGHIIKSVTGEDFFNYTQSTLLKPAGMMNTTSNNIAFHSGNRARGYIQTPAGIREARVLEDDYAFSAGAWSVTGEDIIRYLKAFHLKMLPSDLAGYNWAQHAYSCHPYAYNGGRFFNTYRWKHYVSHNGGTPGFSSSWIHIEEDSISVVILINRQDYAPIDQLAHEVLTHYIPESGFPTKRFKTKETELWEKRISGIIDSILTDRPLPDICSHQLHILLESENGRGLWKWFFSGRYPESIKCIDSEKNGLFTQYHFRIRCEEGKSITLSAMINEHDELVRLFWF